MHTPHDLLAPQLGKTYGESSFGSHLAVRSFLR